MTDPDIVVERHIVGMAVKIRNVAGHNWGWFSNEEQRMHIQTLEAGFRKGPGMIKVWLESNGKRTFELAHGSLSAKDLKTLKSRVEAVRDTLEALWIDFMLQHDWIRATLSGRILTVTAYPQSNTQITRTVDLSTRIPGAYPHWDHHPIFLDFDLSTGMIQVGPHKDMDDRYSLPLEGLLWK